MSSSTKSGLAARSTGSQTSYTSDGVIPIAVVGMGFRGPGDASDLDGLWKMIEEKREAWSPVPKDRWNHEAFYHPDSNRNGTTNVLGGHFMHQDLQKFDAPFFSMTRAEAEALDPQQRLLLECSYEALENAGIPMDKVSGSNTCCFVGSFCGDYTDLLSRDPETTPFYQATGSGHSRAIIANRLSYFFDLRGPSVTIDTACSASLVALHLACQSLRSGETNQALVAGANVILGLDATISMSMMRFLSPDGRCYSFDERANGYSRGEGVGCVFLKPLADALRDGDPIRAVIRNTGANQDGKTSGITLPNREAQEDLIRSVYAKADMDPTMTSFVECHGTGTLAGDPLETAAIANIFTKNRPDHSPPLLIGSVKTNIGHLEGASGVAGLIKAVLMLEKDKVLPNRNFETPSKRIPFAEWKLKVPVEVQDFHGTGPRVISVDSFGYGGTNAHAIVQDAASSIHFATSGIESGTKLQVNGHSHDSNYGNGCSNGVPNGHDFQLKHNGVNGTNGVEAVKPHENYPNNEWSAAQESTPLISSSPTRVFILSAFEDKTVRTKAESLAEYLKKTQWDNESHHLDDMAYTLSDCRTKLSFGAAVYASSKEELISAFTDSSLRAVRATKNAALGFVFTGQGAQWWAMGRELFTRFPMFSQSISTSGAYLRHMGADWDLRDELFKDATSTRVNEAEISQPVCTALQVALVDLLASFDVRPAAVTGHSSGEIAAAYCAGALSTEDAISVSYHRGLVSKLAKERSSVPGAMMAINMSEVEATDLLKELKDGKVGVACINSPGSLTVSGDESGVDELKTILDGMKVFARKLAVDVAYHSDHMAYVTEDYLKAILDVKPLSEVNPDCIFYSSVTGRQESLQVLGPQYWVDNMLGKVRFESALREMCETPIPGLGPKSKKSTTSKRIITALCEVGPHSALAGPARQILSASAQLRDRGIAVLSCLVRKKDAERTMADTVCKMSVMGFPVNIAAFNTASLTPDLRKPKVLSDLPPYPWSHAESYWAESRLSKERRLTPYGRSDLLGVPVPHFNPSEPRWRNIIRTGEMPWVKDHRVQGSVVYPAAGFVAMALEATALQARERSVQVTAFELREVTIGQALVIPDDRGEVEVIISLRPFSDSVRTPSDSWNEFSISSVSPENRWTEHSRGLVRAVATSKPDSVSTPLQLDSEKSRVAEFTQSVEDKATWSISPEEFYEKLSKLGLDYGPMFANAKSLRAGHNTAVSSIQIADTASVMPNNFEYPFFLHPSTLDSLFHPLFAALGLAGSGNELQDPFVPVSINRLILSSRMRREPGVQLSTWTEAKRFDDRQISASTVVFDSELSSEEPVLQIEGLNCTKIAREDATTEQGLSRKATFGYKTTWLPDVDELSSSDFTLICDDLVPETREENAIESFEKAGYFLMKRAFGQITDADVERAHPHHKRLYNCMRARLTEHDGQYAAEDSAVESLLQEVSSLSAEGDLLVHVGQNLVPIIQQSRDALELMLEGGRLDAFYRDNWRFDRNYKQATRYLNLAAHKNPNMSMLEIGSGTGGATLPVLQALTDSVTGLCRLDRFVFTDISTGFFQVAKEKLAQWSNLVSYAKLDIEADPVEQGFEEGAYDVILAANVLHATRSMKNTMANVRKLLKPGGKLVLVELTRERFTTSTIFGTLPGWFAGEEEDRVRGPTLTEDKWDVLLREAGFDGLDMVASDARSEAYHQGSMMVATACEHVLSVQGIPRIAVPAADILIIHEETAPASISVEEIRHWLQSRGARAVTTGNMASCQPEGKACIVLSELSIPLFQHPTDAIFEKLKNIFTTAASILWVTKGALIRPTDPTSNMVTGFARAVKSEYGHNIVVTLDLDSVPATAANSMQAIQSLTSRHLLQRGPVASTEHEYVERDGQLLIPRLTPHEGLQKAMRALLDPSTYEMVPFEQPDRSLVVNVGTPGLIDTIVFVDDKRVAPDLPTDAVEISVKASGMIFKDIMVAMGQIAVEALGGECSGVIRRVGTSVKDLAVGDRVSCYGFGTFANLVRQDAAAVQKISDDISFELAAALPVNFCTAYYSVVHVARVQKSQTVLIHAASGGLGQALIELCKMLDAEIFCTVGTVEKKQLLMDKYGIPEDHILTSRDARFAPAIMRMTNGRGVDVIMNSVAGEMLRLTWDCIAPFGVFIELGARDYTINTRLEMAKFAQNVTFASVNLAHLMRERPTVAAQVWSDVMKLFREKKLHGPTPLTTYSISQLEPALRLMQSGKHVGKLVVVHSQGDMVKATPHIAALKMTLFKADAAYLLVGGMGGLGRATALWMLAHGARNFIFASRSGLDRVEARELKAILESSGANVVVGKCDVSKMADLEGLMSKCGNLPPVKGVIQGAMVLQDCFLSNMQVSDYAAVVKPKVDGTWNLHHLFESTQLDFFVMLSSTAGIIGNASQAAYAASSTFLDSFALYRRAQGLAASTIDLGVIKDIGYVAQNHELAQALERQGFEGTDEEHLMALLHSAVLASPPVHDVALGHMVTGMGTWNETSINAFDRPIFSHFRQLSRMASEAAEGAGAGTDPKNGPASSVRSLLKSSRKRDEAEKVVCEGLVAKVSSLTMIPVEDISTDRPLAEYGLDSLVAVEMRNWIAREIDAAVPVLELMANEPIHKLAARVLLKSRLVDLAKLT